MARASHNNLPLMVNPILAAMLAGYMVAACSTPPTSTTFTNNFQQGVMAYDRGDYAAARTYWQPLADNYDLAALRNIGHLYRLGQGVARNKAKAADYYRRAAELGFAPAQLNLAQMLEAGDGIARDARAAQNWATRAAQSGYAPARAWLAVLN
ncbi:MAG: sel1 repeat family protein [PS1 clade bacterium]|nr:sel1 repeat family protein [PS1 clade bacterium]CAI8312154.1 MAG: Putative beta-lactamase HcpD [Rhodobiaceae bacterium UBA7378]HCQ82883.1 sel1 repeat family protein [Rhodobiaceae bacterium]|tara:strand:- start:981 stop:1439 length:459 start_codon:yes stop_codon:yes gene_type:complete